MTTDRAEFLHRQMLMKLLITALSLSGIMSAQVSIAGPALECSDGYVLRGDGNCVALPGDMQSFHFKKEPYATRELSEAERDIANVEAFTLIVLCLIVARLWWRVSTLEQRL